MLNTLGSTETSAGKTETKPVGKKRQPPSNHNKEWQTRERRKLYSPYRITKKAEKTTFSAHKYNTNPSWNALKQ